MISRLRVRFLLLRLIYIDKICPKRPVKNAHRSLQILPATGARKNMELIISRSRVRAQILRLIYIDKICHKRQVKMPTNLCKFGRQP
jgi:hypothetical protein